MEAIDTQPLDSLDDLWDWDRSKVDEKLVGLPLKHYSGERGGPKTLICHDMMGGYLPEECTDGCEVIDEIKPYIVTHWWYIDIFAYFSHRFITIPPVGWINQAHDHGVLVLGTFITEWKGGAKMCEKILCNVDTVERTVSQMVQIAVAYNFDGWLINIENEIEALDLPNLDLFLASLTAEMRIAIGERSRVIWYDAVTVSGELKWQNELNDKNERWFDLTDGIFINYPWKPQQLVKSSQRAKDRLSEVYVGVDCFGRGTCGGGGWNCYKAFSHAREQNLSVALFAPGWVAQKFPQDQVVSNSTRFWDRLSSLVQPHPVTALPITTNFSVGLTTNDHGSKFYNMSAAQMQPHYLESGAFLQSFKPSLIFPEPGDFKLFLTKLTLNGIYEMRVAGDALVQPLFWKDDDGRDLPVKLANAECKKDGCWYIQFCNELICGIGLNANSFTILSSFSFGKVECDLKITSDSLLSLEG